MADWTVPVAFLSEPLAEGGESPPDPPLPEPHPARTSRSGARVIPHRARRNMCVASLPTAENLGAPVP